MVYVVNSVLASGVDIILEEDFVYFALQEMEIHPSMLLIQTLSMILQTFALTFHNPKMNHTRVNYVGTTLIMVMIVHHGCRLGPHEDYQCQPWHQNYPEFNPCYDSNSYVFDQPTQYSIDHQPQSIQEDLNQQRMNDVLKAVQSLVEKLCQQEQAANLSTHNLELSRRFSSIYYDDDDDEESTIPLNEIFSQIPPSIAITHVLPIMEPEDSLIMGDENLSTIPKKESDGFIKSSVEDLVPIPRGNFVTFSNPLFNDNDAFTSSDDDSLLEEDVPKENFKIYSNPLFEFDDEYISSNVNPLFDEVLENIESKDSYVSNLDDLTLLVTPLSDANEDECFDPGGKIDEIDAFLEMDISTDIENGYHDSEGDIIYLESLLINDSIPNLPPEVFLDHDPKSLNNKSGNLKSMDKVFDPGI
ncbi:hypothetical protein Tco_0201036 [Tanacetum coccineum]